MMRKEQETTNSLCHILSAHQYTVIISRDDAKINLIWGKSINLFLILIFPVKSENRAG